MLIHSKLSQCTDYHISRKSPLMARTLVMAEEMDDKELLLVVVNKTVLFQRVVKCFDDPLKKIVCMQH